ncbi:MAG: XTP/dITP diphosphatase [Candidatus Njordarchaeales archaeon]
MFELFFATGNKHKILEINEILKESGLDIKLVPIRGNKIEIQAETLEEIVSYALKQLKKKGVNYVIVEDAGLFINYFKGFPGPYSHYVYKKIGNKGILKLMDGIKDRSAYFKSVIGLIINGNFKLFSGVSKGKIANEIRGRYGFGFDPIFIPEGYSKTFGELQVSMKNRLSHRGKSARKLAEYLRHFFV